mgnify:CR=1 FL=1
MAKLIPFLLTLVLSACGGGGGGGGNPLQPQFNSFTVGSVAYNSGYDIIPTLSQGNFTRPADAVTKETSTIVLPVKFSSGWNFVFADASSRGSLTIKMLASNWRF